MTRVQQAGATATDVPVWLRQVQIAHAWMRDVSRGDGPVYIVAVLPWLITWRGFDRNMKCPQCASKLAVTDSPDVTGYVIAHRTTCRWLRDLIDKGIADGVLTADGEAIA